MPLLARDLMEPNVLTIPAASPFREIQHVFVLTCCHLAPVVDADDRVIGTVSALDLLRASDQASDDDLDPGEQESTFAPALSARELATPEPVWVRPDTPAHEIAQTMRKEATHHVLVGVDGKLEGIISTYDLMRAVRE